MGLLIGGFVGFGFWLILKSWQPRKLWRPKGQISWLFVLPVVSIIGVAVLSASVWLAATAAIAGVIAGQKIDEYTEIQKLQKSRLKDSLLLPNLIDLLSVSLTAGLSLRSSLTNAIQLADSEIQKNWQGILTNSEKSFAVQLEQVSRELPGFASAKLAEQLLISIERGTALLPMLDAIAVDIRSTNYRMLHEKAAAKDVWMMLPVVFGILPSVTAIAIYPALTTLSNI